MLEEIQDRCVGNAIPDAGLIVFDAGIGASIVGSAISIRDCRSAIAQAVATALSDKGTRARPVVCAFGFEGRGTRDALQIVSTKSALLIATFGNLLMTQTEAVAGGAFSFRAELEFFC